MTFVDLLRTYQGERSLRRFARDLGVDQSILVRLYSGERQFSAVVLWAFLRTYPGAAHELVATAHAMTQVA